MALATSSSSRPVHVRAPANRAMGAGMKQVAGAAAASPARRVVVTKAIGNGVSQAPATPLNIVFVSAEVAPWSKTGEA